MLGSNFTPEFFNGLSDAVADPLKRICNETLEDLAIYRSVLEDFGVKVIQPELDNSLRFVDDVKGITKDYGRGPLQPRDDQLILGNTGYTWNRDHPAIAECLIAYAPKTIIMPHIDMSNFNSATVFMVGKDVYHPGKPKQKFATTYDHIFRNHRRNVIADDLGHTDGCFHTLKPGAILSLFDIQNYETTFPGWDICYLPDESWAKVRDWNQFKRKNAGKWYLAGETDNDEFIHFVNTWLTDWVGYVEESVFDVNVVVLDEHHVCISNPHNQLVNAFLKKHKMKPVYVPFRHRWFWDGGLHCITLDLYREGTQQDYFPERVDQTIVHKL